VCCVLRCGGVVPGVGAAPMVPPPTRQTHVTTAVAGYSSGYSMATAVAGAAVAAAVAVLLSRWCYRRKYDSAQNEPPSAARRRTVVVLGGGFAGTELVRQLRRCAELCDVVLISDDDCFEFTPAVLDVIADATVPAAVSTCTPAHLKRLNSYVRGVVYVWPCTDVLTPAVRLPTHVGCRFDSRSVTCCVPARPAAAAAAAAATSPSTKPVWWPCTLMSTA
jgi:hypothetical protein